METQKRIPMGTAYVGNGWRVLYDIEEIKHGPQKGHFRCYYRHGYNYHKAVVTNFQNLENKDAETKKI